MKTKEITEGFFSAIANIAQDAVDGKFAPGNVATQGIKLKAAREKSLGEISKQFHKRWSSMVASIAAHAASYNDQPSLDDYSTALDKISSELLRLDPSDDEILSRILQGIAHETLNANPDSINNNTPLRRQISNLVTYAVKQKATTKGKAGSLTTAVVVRMQGVDYMSTANNKVWWTIKLDIKSNTIETLNRVPNDIASDIESYIDTSLHYRMKLTKDKRDGSRFNIESSTPVNNK